jgi:NADPH-dependent ferric siderophore reductase
MTTPTAPTPTAARPRKPRYPAAVRRVQRLSPRMVRVTFTSPELADFGWNGPAAHIKLIFGGDAAAGAPAPGAPADAPRPIARTYTPRRFDRDARELDVDFVLHGDGPAAAWAAQAEVGQTLTVAGPGRSYAIDPEARWWTLAGDDSAIPAIATILEQLPANGSRARAFIEVVDATEERDICAGCSAVVTWLHRGEDPTRAGTVLESALRDFEFPADSGRVYVACEAGAMRRIRRHLLSERGMNRDHIVTRGYWKLGATDHPDGDYGQDA